MSIQNDFWFMPAQRKNKQYGSLLSFETIVSIPQGQKEALYDRRKAGR